MESVDVPPQSDPESQRRHRAEILALLERVMERVEAGELPEVADSPLAMERLRQGLEVARDITKGDFN